MKDGEEEKRCVLFCRSGDCLSGLDHGRFGQGLCSGCEALSGVRYADDPEGVEQFEVTFPAKEMLLVDEVDSKAFFMKLFEAMYDKLPSPKQKRKNNGVQQKPHSWETGKQNWQHWRNKG